MNPPASPPSPGGGNPPSGEYILIILERLEKRVECLDDRLRCVEKELSSVKVWAGVLSVVVPAIVAAVLTRGL